MLLPQDPYTKFRQDNNIARVDGIRRDPNLANEYGGAFIVLIPAPEIARAAEEFSRHIAALVPAVAYEAEPFHLHTTLGSYGYGPRVNADPDNPTWRTALDKMCEIVESAIHAFRKQTCSLVIEYKEYTCNQNVAIAPGYHNTMFTKLVGTIINDCSARGMMISPPWSAKMTVSRFMADKSPFELVDFWRLFKTTPLLGKNIPVGIAVGYSLWQPNSQYPSGGDLTRGHFAAYRTFPF